MESTIGYRRLLYRISERLTSEERRGLVYMRLFKDREKYKDADTLVVLSKLEAGGAFSSANPEGLLAVAKDLKRPDIAKKVRQYIKQKDKSEAAPDSTEILSEPLRDQLGRLLSSVTTLTEQCSRESSDAGASGGARDTTCAKGVEGALQTVDILSEVLLKVKKELKNCRQEGRVVPRVRRSSSSCSDVRPTANMTTTTARRLPKMSLPAIPSPKAQPESSEVKPTANMTTSTARRTPKMELPAIPSSKAQPESSEVNPTANMTSAARRPPRMELPAIPSSKAQPEIPARVLPSKQMLPQLKVQLRPPIAGKPSSKGLSKAVSMSTLPRRGKGDPWASSEGLRHGVSVEQLQAHVDTYDPIDTHVDTTGTPEDTYEDLADALDHMYDYIGPPIPTRSSSVRVPQPKLTPPQPFSRKPGTLHQQQGRSLLVRGPLNDGGTGTGKPVPVQEGQERQGYGGLQNGRAGRRYV